MSNLSGLEGHCNPVKARSSQGRIQEISSATFTLIDELEKSFDGLVSNIQDVLTPCPGDAVGGVLVNKELPNSILAERMIEINKRLDSLKYKVNRVSSSVEV